MTARKKIFKWFSGLIIASAIFFIFPGDVRAQVVIQKFSSDNGTDWVEVHNFSEETVDLSALNYRLKDTSSSGNIKNLNCILPAKSGFSVDWGNSLNKDGDRIELTKNEQAVDCVAYGDGNGQFCLGQSSVNLEALLPGEYGVRDPVGTGSWKKTNDSARASDYACLTIAPTLTPSPTPLPTPSPTPSPDKAIYQINQAKSSDGEELSTVKIYVDDQYIHHYTPETLEFCEGCFCYQENEEKVNCGLGDHTIKLVKSGYLEWRETRSFSSGDSVSVNPILSMIVASPTPTPVLSPTTTPGVTPTTKPEALTPTPQGEVLGEEASQAFYPLEEVEKEAESTGSGQDRSPAIAKIFLGSGLAFLFSAGLYGWYTIKKKGVI